MSMTTLSTYVVCPICSSHHTATIVPGYNNFLCPKTKKVLTVLSAKTRAKNQHSVSRHSRSRVYQIRLILPNQVERLVEFRSDVPRFELRAGDHALITYYRKRPKIVQNCTIHQYMIASSDGCFIATAVYGSYEAGEVLILREFRDQELASSDLGRFLIRCYYFISPPIAELLEIFPFAKKPVKYVLDKTVRSVQACVRQKLHKADFKGENL